MESDLPLGKTTLIFGDPSKDLSLASEKLGAASTKDYFVLVFARA